MKEDILHYLWQYQHFDRTDLRTTSGKPVVVVKQGQHHADAGPDFQQAQLRIGEVDWAGSVEIHIKASDWDRHRHQHDPNYDNVILHVVWDADREVLRTDKTPLPTLELKHRVAPALLARYQALVQLKPGIPCVPFYPQVPELTRLSMLDRVLHERLSQKAEEAEALLEQNRGDWEETAYQLLARSFGMKINSEPLLQLARALPLATLRKHQDSQLQLEALLLGQAGLLEEAEADEYVTQLQREYRHLSHKYQLQPRQMSRSQWNFLRLRPANFPTLRLAQLAALLYQAPHLRNALLEPGAVADYDALLQLRPSAYWEQHYLPGKVSRQKVPGFGQASVQSVLVNAVVPLLVAYSRQFGSEQHLEKAVALLESVPAEHNKITALYEELGQRNRFSADSQALLHLHRYYCQPVRCLACAIGVRILKA